VIQMVVLDRPTGTSCNPCVCWTAPRLGSCPYLLCCTCPCRSAREMQDTPSIFSSSIAVAWLLAAAPQLSPANMATLAQLLVSNNPPCLPLNGTSMPAAAVGSAQHVTTSTAGASAGAPCLMSYPKGRAVLLRVGRQWKLLDSSLREAREQAGGRRLSGSLKAASEQHENAQPATGLSLGTIPALGLGLVWYLPLFFVI
jgi:hypothetical protein